MSTNPVSSGGLDYIWKVGAVISNFVERMARETEKGIAHLVTIEALLLVK